MAGENTAAPAAAPATEPATQAEGTESALELRDALVERLKANRAEREAGTQPEKPTKPKRGEPAPKKAAEGDDAAHDDDSPELAAHKAERRAFAKAKRKKEAEFTARESQLNNFEARAKAELATVDKDPVAWLKARGVNVRKLLLDFANEDAEDPRDKKLRELEAKQNRAEEETKREKAEREARESKGAQANAVAKVEKELGKAWEKAEVDDYPTVAAALEPEHVAQRAAEIMVEHFRAWHESGRQSRYKELAPSDVFAIMEEELAPLKGKLANGKKKPEAPGAGPGSKRETRKAATPEAPPQRERPTRKDVTRSVTREPSVGRPLNFDRDAIRERLVEKARAATR